MIKSLWKNEHFKSGLYAVIFVAIMVGILLFLEKIPGSLPSPAFVDGIVVGLLVIIFPKSVHKFSAYISGKTENPYDKKTALKYRLVGLGIIIIAIMLELTI